MITSVEYNFESIYLHSWNDTTYVVEIIPRPRVSGQLGVQYDELTSKFMSHDLGIVPVSINIGTLRLQCLSVVTYSICGPQKIVDVKYVLGSWKLHSLKHNGNVCTDYMEIPLHSLFRQ